MRNNVSFCFPEEFERVSEEEGILSVQGAEWFVSILKKIPGIQVNEDLCQEDWGVVVFVNRNEKRFWVGLSQWSDGEFSWLAHVHHNSYAWLQRWSRSGKREFDELIMSLDRVLTTDPNVSEKLWYHEKVMNRAYPRGSHRPSDC